MAALAMRADLAGRTMANDPAAGLTEMGKIEDLARLTSREMRYLQFILAPQALEGAGLALALDDLVSQLSSLYEIKVELNIDSTAVEHLTGGQQHELFFIAAEALDNVRRHSASSRATLKVDRPESSLVVLEVTDHGTGFSPTSSETYEGLGKYGLALIEARTYVLQGELRLESQPQAGCVVRLAIPARSSR
jgi:NarL family two-component system sensor histidine kinase LiaS